MGATHIIPARPILPSLDRFLGCALGGALGDALGYAVEFDNWEAIQSRFGENGICSPQLDSASEKALISDDTQMTIFTIDGILTSVSSGIDWEFHPRLIHDVTCSYLKWLHTQTGYHPSKPQSMTWESVNRLNYDLMALPELFQKRAPGNTCISALMERAEDEHALLSNHSKGCGGVMRVAPIGMYSYMNNVEAYRYGKDIAAITHRHSASSQASGAMASIISLIMNGKSIRQAVKQTLTLLKKEDFGDKGTEAALCCAIRLADDKDLSVQSAIRELGEGWIAEEALSIAVYCALKAKRFKNGVIYAVNHNGDSDSTGAICGNILGALHGYRALPQNWLANLELCDFLDHLTRIFHKAASIRAIRFAGQMEDTAEFADIYRLAL